MKLTGRQLQQLREAAGLTQFELERLTRGKVNRSVLSFVECGYRTLSAAQETAVLKVLTRAIQNRVGVVSQAQAQAEQLGVSA